LRGAHDLGQSAGSVQGICEIERPKMANKLIISLAAGLVLSGCSIFGDNEEPAAQAINDPEAQTPYAPFTDEVLDNLPEGLIGDVENQAHTNEDLRGDDGVG
jgi:hypothetical protein